jgi:dienelactone hydrolase
MKTLAACLLAVYAAATYGGEETDSRGWSPSGLPPAPSEGPSLCIRDFLTPEQGAEVLEQATVRFPDRGAWDDYAALVRRRIQEGAGLAPWPRRTPLSPIVHSRRELDGYSVENVALETIPGFFATGNLYRPLDRSGPRPVVLSTHGHTRGVTKPEDWAAHGRFSATAQTRAAALARMGAIVFAIDMFGYGDGIVQVGQEAHRTGLAMPVHVWNGIRAIDFLTGIEGADTGRIAVTGESGGGTQAFLLAALDPRVSVSVPVVMVSSYFFGGCPCESGRPIHRSTDHFVNNTMIAALAAPNPQLLVSNGKDWTQFAPEIDLPFLRHVYGLYGASGAVANVHLPDEGHDYGPSKRAAAYRFLAARLGLDLASVSDDAGAVDESAISVQPPERLRVFDENHPLPVHAAGSAEAVAAGLASIQRHAP